MFMTTYLKTGALIIFMLFSVRLFASPQMPDYIIYKNDTFATYNLILERFLQRRDTTESEKLFGLSFRDGATTNCWRGYQAIYRIENDSLFLTDILSCGERRSNKIDKDGSLEKMRVIFGDRVKDNKVFINWFSDELNFPLKSKLLRWDGVFYRIFEKETVISIYNGRVLRAENVDNYIDNRKSINRKDKNKVSNILFKKIKKTRWVNIDSCDCSEKYLVTIDQDGKVSKVMMAEYETDEKIEEAWEMDEYNYCIKNMLNALKKLRFDIIKDKGKPISEVIYIEIWFEENGKIENWTD